ncbi:MAG: efflux RND transporter periplasmic adaptor subunit [Anaerolineae bacterium]
MRRTAIIVVILLLVGGAGYAAHRLGNRPRASQNLETVTVQRGNIIATVSATGSVAPAREVTLTFRSGGKVARVLVAEGQAVQKGDTLTRLETADLEQQLAQAQASLTISEARLAQIEAGPDPEELAAARASLESAQANLERLREGPSEEEIIIAQADLERARIALEQAQAEYDKIAWWAGVGMTPQAAALQQASIEYESAQARYNLAIAGPTESEIKSAEAQVAQAQAQLEKLLQSPTPEELTIARAEVDRAKANLRQIQLQLEGAEIVAPFSGIVAYVGAQEGELVTTGTPIIRLIDPSTFHLNLDIDEVDIAKILVGQEVTITLDSLPDREFVGEVGYIAPTATVVEGIVTYEVKVEIGPTDIPLKAGMTANATIVTERKEGVLLLSNQAIQIDRESGRTYVEKMVQGEAVPVEIEMGLQDELVSEVVRGLEEGDEVVVQGLAPSEGMPGGFRLFRRGQ